MAVGDTKSAALAGAIVAMSQSLRIVTVAEGIENAEQADRMRDLGCTYGQGFFFARPLTAMDVEAATRAIGPAVVAGDAIDARTATRRRAAPSLARPILDVRPA